ncbi:hypothetical protein [Kineococcus xinjiangensis]|nr:hypothetical protein [Kineococcus xinjiangensis]
MPKLVVEIHVPLVPAPDVADGEYEYPWILDLDDYVMDLDEETDGAECLDDSEDYDGSYVFFITGSSEEKLLAIASKIAARSGVPAGAFAMVTDDEAEGFGMGRRVELPAR